MYSRALKRCFGSTNQKTLAGTKGLASPFHLKPQPGLLAFAKNNESGIVVGVYSKREIPHPQDFDIQIKVRGGEVVQVSHSAQLPVASPSEDLSDDYLEMLSSMFPDSDLLLKVRPR